MPGNRPEPTYGSLTSYIELVGNAYKVSGRIVFTHEIDSHHNFNISNPCPFISLPDGDELETGTMARPDKPGSPMTDYEEIWRHLPRRKGPEGPAHGVSWILESDGGALGEGRYNITKVFMGRIGATYLALHQEQVHVRSRASDGELLVKIAGGDVSARREEWFDGHWEVKYNLGPSSGDLPSMAKDVEEGRQGQWRIPGEKVTVGGHVYIVRAFEEGV